MTTYFVPYESKKTLYNTIKQLNLALIYNKVFFVNISKYIN